LSNAVQAAPPALASTLVKSAAGSNLIEALLRRLLWRRLAGVGAGVAVLVCLIVGVMMGVRQRQAAQAAALINAAQGVRNLMFEIERSYASPDARAFVALVYFRDNQEELFGPVLAEYVRAQSPFRREMARAFNTRQRPFDATFRELCVWQPRQPTNYIRSASAVTNVMIARYPVRFVKAGAVWKWDMFEGLSPEKCGQHMAVLRHKTALLDQLTAEMRQGTATNLLEILEIVQTSKP
jgi:hypothetical protein